MKAILRSLYRNLPVIKELRKIQEQLGEIRENADQIKTHTYRQSEQQLASYRDELLRAERHRDPRNLSHYEKKVFSQGGEDGITDEIFRRIGAPAKTFVEIGAGEGLECNTAYLLWQGWSGWWIEGEEWKARRIESHFQSAIADGRLKLLRAKLTAENAAATLQEFGVPEEFDYFSLDIDRNTYWIWNALPHLRPRAAVIEYNAAFPPSIDWKAHYDPAATWNGSFYAGASLKAYEALGRKFGYNLVGCSLCGLDAFFVQERLCGEAFEGPFTAEKHYEPCRYFLPGAGGLPACFRD